MMDRKDHRKMLRRWLEHADTYLGMNLQFDLQYLRYWDPTLRDVLTPHKTLIDLSVLNFLENPDRPERSLKDIGVALGLFTYETTLKDGTRFNSLDKLTKYAAEDTHNVILCMEVLARRLFGRYSANSANSANSAKTGSGWLSFYSDTIWACIAMSEAGVPFNIHKLRNLHNAYVATVNQHEDTALHLYDLVLSGDGSNKSKQEFLERAMESTVHGAAYMRNHPLLALTPKKGEVSFSDANRSLIRDHLPENHLLRGAFDLIEDYTEKQKVLSTYTFPALKHARKKEEDKTQKLVPPLSSSHHQNVWLDHPTWYVVPSRFESGEGGTQQARVTCKKGPRQTDPKAMKMCRASRFRGGLLLSIDLSQIELRVAALMSGDAAMLKAYVEGLDLHTRRAIDIFGYDYLIDRYPVLDGELPERWKDLSPVFDRRERQVGKRINFADLFRAGPNKMQESVLGDIGMFFELAFFEKVVGDRPRLRPGLTDWQDRLIETAHDTGQIILPILGQSRNFHGGEKYDVNEVVNFPVQTTAANVLMALQHRLMHDLTDPQPPYLLYLNVYDALYFDCRSQEAADELIEARIPAAVAAVSSPSGYWGRLQEEYGTRVPLKYSVERGR